MMITIVLIIIITDIIIIIAIITINISVYVGVCVCVCVCVCSLQPDVLQKRYIQMQKLVDEKRFKEPRILEMFDQFEKRLHPDVKKRLAATEP